MDCSLPGSSVHGIFQARVLEWVAISFSRGCSRLRDWTQVSRTAGRCFTPLSHQGLFCPKGTVICISEVIDISPGNLYSSCASSSFIFCMMYFAYKLNKQGVNMQPCNRFPICNQSVVLYPVLTDACCSAYKFLRRQVRWSGIPISLRIFHSLFLSTQWKALM